MYKALYRNIIINAKRENRTKNSGIYYESHHIVPEFMFSNRKRKGPKGHLAGDPDHKDNLILLTFQEHLMAHYYLYETLKNTHYEYPAGSALQFFFIKATGNHIRHRNLSEVDEVFLNEMAHLRQIGIQSISNARKGKMPAVDSLTQEKIGSVPVDHPKVLSGEWVHHSKGKKNCRMKRDMCGNKNTNYRPMTDVHKTRIYDCISRSIIDECYFSKTKFLSEIKKEFIEFKKISEVWIKHNLGNTQSMIDTYNDQQNTSIVYNRYYRGSHQRAVASTTNKSYCWVTNGHVNTKLKKSDSEEFLKQNPTFKRGKIQHD